MTRIKPDPSLAESFRILEAGLPWTDVAVNLQSCEQSNLMFLRVNLQKYDDTSYAGSSNFSPIPLPRASDSFHCSFFVRLWVREAPDDELASASPRDSAVQNSSIAVASQEGVAIIRVNVNRAMTIADTFMSSSSSAWMFTVARVDSVLESLPNIRFAVSIERTVTEDERRDIDAELPAKAPCKTNITTTEPVAHMPGVVSIRDQVPAISPSIPNQVLAGPAPTTIAPVTAASLLPQVSVAHAAPSISSGAIATPATAVAALPSVSAPVPGGSQRLEQRLSVLEASVPSRSSGATTADAAVQTSAAALEMPNTTCVAPATSAAIPLNAPHSAQVPAVMTGLPPPAAQMQTTTPVTTSVQQTVVHAVSKLGATAKHVPHGHQQAAPRSQSFPSHAPSVPASSPTARRGVAGSMTPKELTRASSQQPQGGTLEAPSSAAVTPSALPDAPKKPPIHPYLMMWVNRKPSDPYEPIFVAEDEAFHARATRSYIAADISSAASRYNWERLGRVPSSALPADYAIGPDLDAPCLGRDDSIVLMIPGKRPRPLCAVDGNGATADDDESGGKRPPGTSDEEVVDANYIEAVRAAAEYNASLNASRKDLHSWYIDDARLYTESLARKKLHLNDDDSSSSD
jgi:hypothetical protein